MRYAKLRRSLLILPLAIAGASIADMPANTGNDMTVLQDRKASPGTVRVSRLLDITVNDPAGTDVGHINDIVLNRSGTDVAYIALAKGMPGAIGRKVVALPYGALRFGGPEDRRVYTQIPESALTSAQGINESMYPLHANADLTTWVETNLKPSPAVAAHTDMKTQEPTAQKAAAVMGEPGDASWTQRASMLIGTNVLSPAGDRLGSVRDILITCTTGEVNYALVVENRGMGMEGDYYAVPLSAFGTQAQGHKLVLGLTPDELKRMPGFDKDHWPTIADPKWTALKAPGEPALQQ